MNLSQWFGHVGPQIEFHRATVKTILAATARDPPRLGSRSGSVEVRPSVSPPRLTGVAPGHIRTHWQRQTVETISSGRMMCCVNF
jgi:hypothetical protein